ncbi:MAG: hypothetical protein M1825_004771 [Sarcosagium campestre]|nr:MAG: hypothetical protein M1825_004771 [Sarcosagium campestre]
MDSVLISDVLPAPSRFPCNMLTGDGLHPQHSTAETTFRSTATPPPAQAIIATSPRGVGPGTSPAPSSTPLYARNSQHAPSPARIAGATSVPSGPRSVQHSPARIRPSDTVARPSPCPSGPLGSLIAQTSPMAAPQPPNEADSPIPSSIKIRDLAHIQQLAHENALQTPAGSLQASANTDEVNVKYEISTMPVTDIIEMVAGLLTKITSTNDSQHERLHRQMPPPEPTASMSQQTSSVLAFHGKNVPSITILSYLSRIHKYCPTTYEVFLSLLVYFDRMTERVNAAPEEEEAVPSHTDDPVEVSSDGSASTSEMQSLTTRPADVETALHPHSSGPRDAATDLRPASLSSAHTPPPPSATAENMSKFLVVDSFNIHRLVIAGVTCASKFFSDVFYTNSRYAKVGGLPLIELNHLEVQFLLLNDFRLSIPVEELEAYGTMLVEFYAREVMAQTPVQLMDGVIEPGPAETMRTAP